MDRGKEQCNYTIYGLMHLPGCRFSGGEGKPGVAFSAFDIGRKENTKTNNSIKRAAASSEYRLDQSPRCRFFKICISGIQWPAHTPLCRAQPAPLRLKLIELPQL